MINIADYLVEKVSPSKLDPMGLGQAYWKLWRGLMKNPGELMAQNIQLASDQVKLLSYGLKKATGRDVEAVARVDVFEADDAAGLARIGDTGGDVVTLFVVGDAPEENRVGFASVVAPEGDKVGLFDVFITRRRSVGAVGMEVAGDGGGHAHAGVGFDGIAAQDAFDQQVLDPLGFHGELAGAVEADVVRALDFDDFGDACGDEFFGFLVGCLAKDVVVEAVEQLKRGISWW